MDQFRVTYRVPGGQRARVEIEAESHSQAAHEGLFEDDLFLRFLEARVETGYASVTRASDGKTEGCILRLSGAKETPSGAPVRPPEPAPVPAVPVSSSQVQVAEAASEPVNGQVAQLPDVPAGKFRYRVIFRPDLEAGHEDRFSCSLDAESEAEARAIATASARLRKGADYPERAYAAEVDPFIEVVGRPADPETPGRETRYHVEIYLGDRSIRGEIGGLDPRDACVQFVTERVAEISTALGPTVSDVPAAATRADDASERWGPGPIRIPVERVAKYETLPWGSQEGVRQAFGIRSLKADAALPLGSMGGALADPDEA